MRAGAETRCATNKLAATEPRVLPVNTQSTVAAPHAFRKVFSSTRSQS